MTYQSERLRSETCPLKERNCDFSSDDSKVRFIGLLEELAKDPFLLRSEVQVDGS